MNTGAKLAWWAMASAADEDTCEVSVAIADLAAVLDVAVHTARRGVNELLCCGVVERIEPWRPGKAARYRIVVGPPAIDPKK